MQPLGITTLQVNEVAQQLRLLSIVNRERGLLCGNHSTLWPSAECFTFQDPFCWVSWQSVWVSLAGHVSCVLFLFSVFQTALLCSLICLLAAMLTCTSLMICSMTSQWKECCHKLGKWHLVSFCDSGRAKACRRLNVGLAQQF